MKFGDTVVFNAIPGYPYLVSLRRYSPLNLPLSYEVVEQRRKLVAWGSNFRGRGCPKF